MKKILIILIAFFPMKYGLAQRFESNGIKYEITSENEIVNQIFPTVKVIQQIYHDISGNVVIPNIVEYGGYKYNVTEIADKAFSDCIGLKSIEIQSGIISIGSRAFWNCKSLNSIKLPNSIITIGKEAFLNCSQIKNLSLPEKIINFHHTELYLTVDGLRFMVENTKEVSLAYNNNYGYSGSVVIPRTISAGNTFLVTSIESEAFYDGDNITSITIPNSITSLAKDIFVYCSPLTSVSIPEDLDVSYTGLEIIQDSVVYRVRNGKEVYISHWDKYPTKIITIPQTITAGNTFLITGLDLSLGFTYQNYHFDFNENITSVTIPQTITYICPGSFQGCINLIHVTCLSTTPPKAYSSSFENYNGYLYIPCDNMEAYDVHTCWGSFKHVKCIE